MTVRCKMRCTHKTVSPYHHDDGTEGTGASLTFEAVHGATLDEQGQFASYQQSCRENEIFGKWTPSASFSTFIANGPIRIPRRPMPPSALLDPENWFHRTRPAPELAEWASKWLLDDSSPLFNEDHQHLAQAYIGYLWAATPARKAGMRIVGQAEVPNCRRSTWQGARQEQQLHEWFGNNLPDFLVTVDADYCIGVTDAAFCALVEHELYHCAQARNKLGDPKFNDAGRPIFEIRGHDVEEFVGVVRRYGAGNGAGATRALVEAAKVKPEVTDTAIEAACGTCLRKAA